MLIEAAGLTVGYGRRKVLENLDFGLQRGTLVCLLGANGSGKSTLLRTLAGLQKPVGGSIEVCGRPIGAYSVFELSKLLSVVLTDRVSGGNMSVYDLVALGRAPYTGWFGQMHAADRKAVGLALEAAGISAFSEKRVSDLSDGERQKVMVARALAQDTPIILMDEPTSHLDLPARIEMMHLLRRLATSLDKAILISMHELDMAIRMADEVGVIDRDGKLATGVPEDLILSGVLPSAFETERIRFDLEKAEFVFRKSELRSLCVSVVGVQPYRSWTERALDRVGYPISVLNPDLVINVQREPNGSPVWRVENGNEVVRVASIGDMLSYLKQP